MQDAVSRDDADKQVAPSTATDNGRGRESAAQTSEGGHPRRPTDDGGDATYGDKDDDADGEGVSSRNTEQSEAALSMHHGGVPGRSLCTDAVATTIGHESSAIKVVPAESNTLLTALDERFPLHLALPPLGHASQEQHGEQTIEPHGA